MKSEYPDHVWSYDFLEDRTERGGRLRCLVIVDEYTRECLSIHVAPSIRSEQMIEELEWLFLTHSVPTHIRSDTGPEFVANAVQKWIGDNGSSTIFITPGNFWKNPYLESFNGKFLDEFLNREIFKNGRETGVIIEAWREDYNKRRPHSSLGNQTPSEFAGSSSPPAFAPLKQVEKSYVV